MAEYTRTDRIERPVGRKPALPAGMRRRIRLMSRGEGKSFREVADWLNAAGVKRPSGKPWDSDAVRLIVIREDQRLADSARAPDGN